jgi:hypothetical protein
MELMIMLAYPIVVLHGKLRQGSPLGQDIPNMNIFINNPAKPGR